MSPDFDPAATIEETVPGLAWRRYLNCAGYPLLGPYDPGQDDIIRWQLETARNAGLECLHVHLWPSIWDDGRDLGPLPIFDKVLERAAALSGKKMNFEYVDQNRAGDHICYISDLSKMKAHYPGWDITKSLDNVFQEIHQAQIKR